MDAKYNALNHLMTTLSGVSDGEEIGVDEANCAKKEFQKILKAEEERIKRISEEKNNIAMEELKKANEDVTCPICLEEVPVITPDAQASMACCGRCLHKECADQLEDTSTCFWCKEVISFENLERIAADKTCGKIRQASASRYLATIYRTGARADTAQHIPKAFSYYQKAAELGEPNAQAVLAEAHLSGKFYDINVEWSPSKALTLCSQASCKGNPNAIMLLGNLNYKCNNLDAALHNYAISAYQGSVPGMERLSMIYEDKFWWRLQKMDKKMNFEYVDAKARTLLICAIFWSGKALERTFEQESYSPEQKEARTKMFKRFVTTLDIAMRIYWHRSLMKIFRVLSV